MFKKITLKNGLRIISVPQKSTRAVTVLVLVATGSKYEAKEISGISHFLEHMFFKGTKKRPDKIEIAETLDKVGGIYNAFTGEEYTGYFAKTSADKFDLALDWVSDIYLNSLLPEKEVKKEKGVIIEEINMIYDNPMLHAGLLWRKLLYGDQPAGRDIAGTKETVSKMTSKLLKDYMEKQYTAQNTIVCLAGNFNHKSAVKKTKEIFSSIKQGSPFKKSKVSESQSSPGIMVHYRDTDQTHLCLGVRAFNIFHPFRYTQDVMAAILGGMMSSRLFIEVREKLGLAYYIKTEADADPDTGFLATLAGVDNKRAEKAISTILKAYKNISRQKVGSLELKKAKDNIKGKLSLMLEPSDAKASFYGIQELSEKRILTPEKLFKEIDKVGSDDILKLGRDIFRPEKLNLALIGPFKNKDKFKKLLV